MFSSCRKDVNIENPGTSSGEVFEYRTTGYALVEIKASAKLAGATFELYTADPEEGRKLLGKGMLNESGTYSGSYRLAHSQESIYLHSSFIGLPGEITIPVVNGMAIHDYLNPGGQNSGKRGADNVASKPGTFVFGNNVIDYLGSFTTAGLPSYLTTINDQVDQSLLADINASLPEGSNILIANPQFIASGNAADLILTDSADVWVTLVHEGAGYKNGLGFIPMTLRMLLLL